MPEIEVGTNSYASINDANDYMQLRLNASNWDERPYHEKVAALITATRAIDRLLLVGRKADGEQPLAFPRHGGNGIPQAVKDATCEEALARLDPDYEFRVRLRTYGITSTSAGNVREGFANRAAPSGSAIKPNTLWSIEARELMRPYIAGSVAIR
jgi:hypothetical protein